MKYGFEGYNKPAFHCTQCAAGRYGASAGLTSAACTGLCREGYYCPAGSTSSQEFLCGHASVYCPEGSPRPIPAAAGRFTLSSIDNSTSTSANTSTSASASASGNYYSSEGDERVRVIEELCPMGSYCSEGVIIPCPVGRYGNTTGLQTDECSGECGDGTYCPAGSVLPSECPVGYFCPTGKEVVMCPAGTFASQTGSCRFVVLYVAFFC